MEYNGSHSSGNACANVIVLPTLVVGFKRRGWGGYYCWKVAVDTWNWRVATWSFWHAMVPWL